MPRKVPDFFDYSPDADFTIVRDASTRGTNNLYLQVDTKLFLTPGIVADLDPYIKSANWPVVYGMIYGFAQRVLDQPGPAHAMLQAACGVIKVNKAKASKLKRIPVPAPQRGKRKKR